MRRTLKFLVVASALVAPAAAHAQACTPAQLAANPLVAMGYRALVRIQNTAFDLSCYYVNLGGGQIGFDGNSPSVTVGSGTNELKATVNQALFTTGANPIFNYGVASNINKTATTPADFVFAFAAPLTNTTYTDANAQVGVTRASGNPVISIVPGGAPSTVPLGGGVPSYLVAQSSFLAVHGGGSTANPFATDLGVDVGNSTCNTGTACSYPTANNNPNANISAWGTIVSYRQVRTTNLASNAQVNGQVDLTAAPEPATLTLMASGLVALVGLGYSRRRNNA